MEVSIVITTRRLTNFFPFDLDSVISISKAGSQLLDSISKLRSFYIANISSRV